MCRNQLREVKRELKQESREESVDSSAFYTDKSMEEENSFEGSKNDEDGNSRALLEPILENENESELEHQITGVKPKQIFNTLLGEL